MDVRKVQVTGGSSYVITLPKDWIRSLNIKKNDPLGVQVQPDGTLLITSRTTAEERHPVKELDVDQIHDPKYLFRLLIGAYIMGYSNLIVRSSSTIEPPIRDTVMDFIHAVIGPEIVEEDDQSITIKDLLNPAEMPFDKTIKRMYMLVNSMHENAISALLDRDISLAEDVIRRDRDVDRLQWLIARQSNMMLEDITLAKKMGITQSSANYYFATSRILERVGDHAVIIAHNAQPLIERKLGKDVLDSISSASKMALGILARTVDAWNHRDMKAANTTIESVKKLAKLCEHVNDHAMRIKGEPAVSLGYISESIRRTGEYASDIAELLINQMIDD